MNRRQLLRSALGFLTGFAVLRKTELCSSVCDTNFPEDSDTARMLSRLFTTPENARAIGVQYLKHYPNHTDRNLLLSSLGPEIATHATEDSPTFLKHLDERRRQDFNNGETVIVNNWILSRTEAGLCALLALS